MVTKAETSRINRMLVRLKVVLIIYNGVVKSGLKAKHTPHFLYEMQAKDPILKI
jgi:hypothetical protein